MARKRLPNKGEARQEVVGEVKKVEAPIGVSREKTFDKESWTPVTDLGRKVKAGQITDIDQILDSGLPILESEIVDSLIPNLQSEILLIGQSKGKFGGGKRTIWRQVQKKTAEGNKPSFASLVAMGNKDGYVGIGYGKAKETVPAREKAIRNAKLNIIKIRRGCGSWACGCKTPHSIPFQVSARCGSCRIELLPAPRGTSLITEKEIRKVLSLAGITDIYANLSGQTRTKLNAIKACFEALKRLSEVKVDEKLIKIGGIIDGRKQDILK